MWFCFFLLLFAPMVHGKETYYLVAESAPQGFSYAYTFDQFVFREQAVAKKIPTVGNWKSCQHVNVANGYLIYRTGVDLCAAKILNTPFVQIHFTQSGALVPYYGEQLILWTSDGRAGLLSLYETSDAILFQFYHKKDPGTVCSSKDECKSQLCKGGFCCVGNIENCLRCSAGTGSCTQCSSPFVLRRGQVCASQTYSQAPSISITATSLSASPLSHSVETRTPTSQPSSSNGSATASRSAIISYSATFSSPTESISLAAVAARKVPVLLPTLFGRSTTTTMTGATTVVAGGVGSVSVPAVAVQAGRTRSLVQMASCSVVTDEDSPPWYVMPLQYSVSAAQPMALIAGTVLYTSLLLLLVPALWWSVAAWMQVTVVPPKFSASLFVATFSYFAPSVPELAIALVAVGPPTGQSVGLFGSGIVVVLFVLLLLKLLRHDPEGTHSEIDREYLYPFIVDSKDLRRALHRCALLEEIGVGVGLSVAAGAAPHFGPHCSAGLWVSLLITVFHLLFIALVRPYSEQWVVVMAIVNSLFLLVFSMCGLLLTLDVENLSISEIMGNLVLAQFLLLGLQSLWMAFISCRRKKPERLEREQPLLAVTYGKEDMEEESIDEEFEDMDGMGVTNPLADSDSSVSDGAELTSTTTSDFTNSATTSTSSSSSSCSS